jgi:hypothetical protein
MSLKLLYTQAVITVDDVTSQIEPLLELPLQDRFVNFYQRNIAATEFHQGDVIRLPNLQQSVVNEDQEDSQDESCEYGLIVSNSCDTEPKREDFISILPLSALESPSGLKFESAAEKNQYCSLFDKVSNYNSTSYFYLPPALAVGKSSQWPGMFGAFQQIRPYSSSKMHRLLCKDPSMVMASLKEQVYYLFLLKFTVHYLRPDDRFAL